MIAHRSPCNCVYCLRPVLTRALNLPLSEVVRKQINDLLADTPDDWHGGAEVTEQGTRYRPFCKHEHTTKYVDRIWCRDCAQWIFRQP